MAKLLKYLNDNTLYNNKLLSLTLLLLIIAIICAYHFKVYYVIIIPILLISLVFLMFVPESLPYVFIILNFIGNLFYQFSYFFTITDLLLFCILIGCFNRYYLSYTGLKNINNGSALNIFRLFILLIIASLLSLLLNVYNYKSNYILGYSTIFLFKLILLSLIFQIFIYYPLEQGKREKLISLCIVLSLFQLPVALIQNSVAEGINSPLYTEVIGTFVRHHSLFAMMMLFALFFSIYRILNNIGKINKIVNFLFAIIFLYLIILSRARSVLFGILFSGAIYFLFSFFKYERKYSLYSIAIIICIIIAYKITPLESIIIETVQSEKTNSLDISSFSRLLVWQETIHHFITVGLVQKIFGTGIGTFRTIPFRIVIWGTDKSLDGAHNNYLHVLSDIGIFGLIVFCMLFFVILKELYHNSSDNLLSKCYFYLTIALLASGMTQETFWFQYAFGSFWFFYIFFLAIILNNTDLKDERIMEEDKNHAAVFRLFYKKN